MYSFLFFVLNALLYAFSWIYFSRICIHQAWEFPGWGQSYCTVIPTSKLVETEKQRPPKHQLDVFRSTAIAGNDLLASVLYTTGICACACGQLAPVVMVLGILALYPYRKIFQECGTAIPLNGGVYVAMLNSSSKFSATFAASCSLISYRWKPIHS